MEKEHSSRRLCSQTDEKLLEAKDVTAVDEFTPTTASLSSGVAQCFYSWREMYPELEILLENIEVLKKEAKTIEKVK